MKKINLFFLLAFLCLPTFLSAQNGNVAINNDGAAPDDDAILDIQSTTKGVLIPRMTTTQRMTLGNNNPPTSLLVFDVTTSSFWFYGTNGWAELASGTPNLISDADNDTKIQVEENTDEDIIRFDLGGNERMVLRENTNGVPRLELIDNSNSSDVYIGKDAGKMDTPSKNGNVGVGFNALYSNDGLDNTAIGSQTLYSNTFGIYNTAIGHKALYSNIIGSNNTAIGINTLYHNTSGHKNIAIGDLALWANTTADNNVAIGHQAMHSTTTGGNNTAVGYLTLRANTEGRSNTALGTRALYLNTTGDSNVAIGNSALSSSTETHRNTAIGAYSLQDNTTGFNNTAIGAYSLYENTTGGQNVAIGNDALRLSTTGGSNVAVGHSSLGSNTTGESNTAIGFQSLATNTTGKRNVAIGNFALLYNETTNNNTAIGESSLKQNTIGADNTAVGSQSLQENTTGAINTAVGTGALISNIIGTANTAIGHYALNSNTEGNDNVALGAQTLWGNMIGTGNVAIGRIAGDTNDANDYCTFIGFDADTPTGATTDFERSTALGYMARINASNQVRIGHSGINSIGGYQAWSNLSDQRFKTNVQDDVPGLDFILKLRPVTYQFDVEQIATALGEHHTENLEHKKIQKEIASLTAMRAKQSKVKHTGFLAQEVAATAKSIGYDFNGVDNPTNDKSLYALRYAMFTVPMVKAIQEQQEEIETLKVENQNYQEALKTMELRLQQLENIINE